MAVTAAVAVVARLWDGVVRAWLVAAAWYGLRRPARLRWLASIGHPRRFVRAAIVPAGRHFALAIAFLPRARRAEATVSFLACKALDAFEDLSADRAAARAGLTAAADYLAGRTARPPRGDRLAATRDSDRLEALLAARLPLLRVALEALPGDAAIRCRALIDRIAAGMLRARPDRRRYADDVLGEAVAFAAEVAAAAPPPRAACRAAGRALQLANDLRDAPTARAREIALYQALPELPIVPRLLRWLPAGAGPGTRAAATLVAVTTCAFYLRAVETAGAGGAQAAPECGSPERGSPEDGSPERGSPERGSPETRSPAPTLPAPTLPARLRHPVRAALAAACSPSAYLATVAAVERALLDTLAAVAGVAALRAGPGGPGLPALPATASDPIASAEALISLAMQLIHEVPAARLDATAAAPGKAIVLADHLLFAAVERLTELGPGSVGRVAALLEQLAAPADRAALARSTALAELAALEALDPDAAAEVA